MTDPAPQGRRAGVVSRLVAAGLDLAAIALLLLVASLGWTVTQWVLRPDDFSRSAPSLPLVVVTYEVVGTLYLAAGWVVTGRSWGQQVMGLRVVSTRGTRLGPLRALARAAICLAVPVGLLWVAVSSSRMSVQDIVLRTIVVHDWTTVGPIDHPTYAPSTGKPPIGMNRIASSGAADRTSLS
jgi:uncharacterized RDD family membrane protein YckC